MGIFLYIISFFLYTSKFQYMFSLFFGQDFMKFWPDEGYTNFGAIKVECLPEDTDDLSVSYYNSLKPQHRTPCQEIVVRNFRITDTRVGLF